MSLKPIKIALSKDRVARLKKGYSIQLANKDIGVGVAVYLSKRNVNKLAKAKKLRKGVRLQMTMKELHYNAKHGSGFFDDLWGGIKSIGEKVLPKVIDKGVDVMIGKAFGGKGIKSKANRRRLANRQSRSKRGRGFFDDIWGGIKTIGEKVAPKVIDKGVDVLIGKAFGGKGAKRGGTIMYDPVLERKMREEMYRNFKPMFPGHVLSARPQGRGFWDVAKKVGKVLKPVAEKGWKIAKPRLEKEGEKLAERGLEALIKKISGGRVKRRKAKGLRRPGSSIYRPGRRYDL